MAASSALPTAQIVIEILEQLIKHTDPEHGLTAAEISKRINVSDKTVRGHLKALQSMTPFDRHVGHLDRRDLVNAESANPRPGWYIEPVFDIAQMRLLVDGAALSSSDGEYLRELIAKIYTFAGKSGQLRGLEQLTTPKNYNTEFLNNIENLNDAIAYGRVIRFRYCTYDVNGNLVPRRNDDGDIKTYLADPYHLMYKNSKYYLLCHMHRYDSLSYLHVERIRDLSIEGPDHSLKRTLDSFSPTPGQPFDIVRHMNERPYPMDGKATPIHMKIHGALEPLYDWFADADVVQTGEREYDVHVVANEHATLWWALQYADSHIIEILSPASLRKMLHDTGEYLVSTYAQQ